MLRLAWKSARAAGPALVGLASDAAAALGGPTPHRPASVGRLILAIGIVVPPALLTRWAMSQLVIVMSPSIDAWVVQPAPGPIAKGDYVMFSLSHPLAGPKPVNVTKYALCLPGERLTMVERPFPAAQAPRVAAFLCGGRWLGTSKPYGRNHQRLDAFPWKDGPLPPGMAYVGSANPNSFDSRYFGPVPIDRLTRMRRVL